MDRIIYHSTTVKCKPVEAFEFFTLNKHLEKWLTKVADVEPKVGGNACMIKLLHVQLHCARYFLI